MRQHDLENHVKEAGDRAADRARYYADRASNGARSLAERGHDLGERFARRGNRYSRQLAHKAEDLADEAGYQYRRARRHVARHPVATVAIVAGTIGAFLLLTRLLRGPSDED